MQEITDKRARRRDRRARLTSALRHFLSNQASAGMVLMGAAALALIVANSPLGEAYATALTRYIGPLNLLHWINDALMAVFFLLVGLEIKREVTDGELSSWSRRILPGMAALGGVVVPALIYLAIAGGDPVTRHGWAVPMATDIAFALGVLALLGSRVPISLKILLTALAIIDDLIAVIIIAVFYTADLSVLMLAGAGGVILALLMLNRFGVKALWPYLLLGVVLWVFVYRSGVHATLAGVALALTIPITRSPAAPDDKESPLHILEHGLSPWVAFLIVPIFGFANAGVSLAGLTPAVLLEPVPLAIALGLFIGKQVGVMAACWVTVKLKWAEMPTHANWRQLYGVALLCGIGFTMSLFIGLLAFPGAPHLEDSVKIGVLMGSLLSALAGAGILLSSPKGAEGPPPAANPLH
ncbi:Na+/H+ antiporter NhaA [Brevundimonas lutea]|uniref:Na+/H+ antiporter NhaA n=1 Tax=Brevundimonas lutea TaxID=2293980 RepID=UPI000F025714|nr:Na+/H+ antiporter NhaA [Brevundimonas lutea]